MKKEQTSAVTRASRLSLSGRTAKKAFTELVIKSNSGDKLTSMLTNYRIVTVPVIFR